MNENSMLHPDRFVWSAGRPIFDILKGLFSGDGSDIDDSIESEFREKFDNSQMNSLLHEREKIKNHSTELKEKISNWQLEISETKNAVQENARRRTDAVLWGNPKLIKDEQVDLSVGEISSWISVAFSAISENNKKIENINREISTEFGKIQAQLASQLQSEVDKHSAEIMRLNNDFRCAITKIATEFEFSVRGGNDNLKIHGIPLYMLSRNPL
jgi:hypothetical protein